MMKWEYKTISLRATGWLSGGKVDTGQLDALMNTLGANGWELVAALSTNEVSGSTRDVLAILKRPA